MKTGVRIAIAVGVGYLLGRTRKLRFALTLAGIGAGRRLGGGSGGLAGQGAKLLGSSPELKTLGETVRGRLVEAGKTAAMTAASGRIDALSDRLQERTRSLTSPPVPGRGGEEPGEEEPGEDTHHPSRAGRGDPEAGEKRPAPRRRTPAAAEGEEAQEREERPRRRPARPGERPVRRRPAIDETDEGERPRRAAARPPVRRTRREEVDS